MYMYMCPQWNANAANYRKNASHNVFIVCIKNIAFLSFRKLINYINSEKSFFENQTINLIFLKEKIS